MELLIEVLKVNNILLSKFIELNTRESEKELNELISTQIQNNKELINKLTE